MEKLYFGCGHLDYHSTGYKNVDVRQFPHVDYVCDISKHLPWDTDSIEEITAERTRGQNRVFVRVEKE